MKNLILVNIKYDKNKIITINEKSNPPIKQMAC